MGTNAYRRLASQDISIIIGATVIHELIGPLASRFTLARAKEINVVLEE